MYAWLFCGCTIIYKKKIIQRDILRYKRNVPKEVYMKLGIVGLPNVGKSTLFNSLTKAGAESANYPFCTIDPNVGIVAVPDERLDKLTEMYNSAKTTPAVIEFVDIAGLVKGASRVKDLAISSLQISERLMPSFTL